MNITFYTGIFCLMLLFVSAEPKRVSEKQFASVDMSEVRIQNLTMEMNKSKNEASKSDQKMNVSRNKLKHAYKRYWIKKHSDTLK